jgi:PPOX class probable F420-dependent enzyme
MVFPNLGTSSYLALTTYRRNGQAVTTPVWFARDGDRLLTTTSATAGKLKRIAHTPQVLVAPCTASGRVTGETAEGVARVLSAREGEAARNAILRRYGLVGRFFFSLWRLRGHQPLVAIEIKPVDSLSPPDGAGGRA